MRWVHVLFFALWAVANAFVVRPLLSLGTIGRSATPVLLRPSPKSSSPLWLSEQTRCDEYAMTELMKPRWGGPVTGPVVRYMNSILFGVVFGFLLGVLNSFEGVRVDVLLEKVLGRDKGRPLLTVSNHQSVLDDPGLWAVLLPYWRLGPEQMRWSICTQDVFFASKFLQPMFGAGNVMPLNRTGSWEQPLFQRFHEKLVGGAWCHVFPEGRVWQNWRFQGDEARLGPFKPGVGKLIAHCPPGKDPIVIPMYHTGMDDVVPEVVLEAAVQRKKKRPSKPQSFVPATGNRIRYYIGQPMDFSAKIAAFREKYPGKLDAWNGVSEESVHLYFEITRDIRDKVLELEAEARGERD